MQTLTLYFDGHCPLCAAEIIWLRQRNVLGLLDFVDVAQLPGELPAGVSCQAALAEMHGRMADGAVLVGVPVFVEAYRRAGLPRLSWVLSRPWLQPVLRYGYTFFARLLGGPLHRLVARTTIVPPKSLPHHADRT